MIYLFNLALIILIVLTEVLCICPHHVINEYIYGVWFRKVIKNVLERLREEEALLHVVVTDCGGVHVSDSWETRVYTTVLLQRLWTQSLSLSWTIQSQRAQKQYRSCDISLYSTSSPLLLQIIQRNSLFNPITSASNTAVILLFIKDALN